MRTPPRPTGALTLAALARMSGVHVETIRYYQRLGLVGRPERRYGSVRYYGDDVLARLRFIKRAQRLGFPLREIRLLAALAGTGCCTAARTLAADNLATIERRITVLEAARDALKRLLAQCEVGNFSQCPILDFLQAAPESVRPAVEEQHGRSAAPRLDSVA